MTLTSQAKSSYIPFPRFSVAPMLDWTDRHCRYFHRLMSRKTLLYTEMVHMGALIFGNKKRFLNFHDAEHPVALQLGGSDPQQLGEAAFIAEDFGYDEINLNVGCPSDRVQKGSFGACLMLQPDLVAECVTELKRRVRIPVTVKCRIGVDDLDIEGGLDNLIQKCVQAGVDGVIVHARKAWLKGLSPKENRTIPPLNYERVYRLKRTNPFLPISINGGILTLEEANEHLNHIDSVMVGRAAYQTPALLLNVDKQIFGVPSPFDNPFDVAEALIPYIQEQLDNNTPLHSITRHILGLFNGYPGARLFRRYLAEEGTKKTADLSTYKEALQQVIS